MHDSKDLDDEALLRRISDSAAQESRAIAVMLSDIAEAEVRKLHLRKGYDSMTAYCVAVVHLSESAARKRVHAARVAFRFPALFAALSDGRLHLTAVRMLATHLTPANVRDLIAESANKSETEIGLMLARRFPQAEPLRLDGGIAPQVVVPQSADPEGRAARLTDPLPDPVPTTVTPMTVKRYRLDTSIDDEPRMIFERFGNS